MLQETVLCNSVPHSVRVIKEADTIDKLYHMHYKSIVRLTFLIPVPKENYYYFSHRKLPPEVQGHR